MLTTARILPCEKNKSAITAQILIKFSAIFWVMTYFVMTVRAELMHHNDSDILSLKRILTTLVGAVLFLIAADRSGRPADKRRNFYVFVALASVAASLALLLFRIAYEALTKPSLSGLTDHGLWVVVWAGYFAAWLALITSESDAGRGAEVRHAPEAIAAAQRPNAAKNGEAEDSLLEIPSSSETEIKAGLVQLAPFHHAIELPFGLSTYDGLPRNHDRNSMGRIDTFKAHAWPRILESFGGTLSGKRVIDVACNCGGFSMLASEAGAREVFGFDSEEHYVRQARFIQQSRDQRNVRFEVDRLENINPERDGHFDLAFFCGILYHLEDPIGGLRKIASMADTIVVDTHLMRVPYVSRFLTQPMWNMKFVAPVAGSDTTTGLWRKLQHCQFTPNFQAVVRAMQFVGFSDVAYLEPTASGLEHRYYTRTRGVFIGRKPT